MPEFFLELFSEEIPARMQAKAADDLARLLGEALAGLQPRHFKTFYGPRRIACAAELHADIPASRSIERGPRSNAPPQAMAGFLRKHAADLSDVREEAGFFVLDRASPAVSAATLIAETLPALLRRFPWPKSMRWGGTSAFTWVRPLRRIICLFDGAIVPFSLRDGDDDGHGLVASNLTEGHRFLAPGEFAVASCAEWQAGLLARKVVVDAAERRAAIAAGIAKVAAEAGYSVVEDAGLLDEVAGLVEWPVPLLGRIGADYMDLPAEVMQVSMRVNQRYFALRTADGKAAPAFAFVANIAATDGGAAIIAGNERVLSARFSDARHFWDLDRRNRLDTRVAALDAITFHAKLGSQGARVKRIAGLAAELAPSVGADASQAARAATLAKADLTTGMVGEFPELQGVIGAYYAMQNEDRSVATAIREHYSPRGPNDAIPATALGKAVALADKFDTLVGFFGIGEKPTGSGDPYALRRAGLGIIRIIREGAHEIPLRGVINFAASQYDFTGVDVEEVLAFLVERLRVQLRGENKRVDVIRAVIGDPVSDRFFNVSVEINALSEFLEHPRGRAVFAGYTRIANILKDSTDFQLDPTALREAEENALLETAMQVRLYLQDPTLRSLGARLPFLYGLADPINAFFEAVAVNSSEPELRQARHGLLHYVRDAMLSVADFSKIDG